MAKVSEAYASPWLRGDDLKGKTVKVEVAFAGLENVRQADGSEEERIVVDFVERSKRLICNRSQALSLAQIAGDDTDLWPGTWIFLAPGVANNGKTTINIMPVPKEGEDERKDIPF